MYRVGNPNRPYANYNAKRPADAVKMYCKQYGINAKGIRRLGKGKLADMHMLLEVTTYGEIKKTATYEVILGE